MSMETSPDRADNPGKSSSEIMSYECQIYTLGRMSEPLGRFERIWQLRYRLRHTIKRRLRYIRNWLFRGKYERSVSSSSDAYTESEILRAGDLVRVKSRGDIQATLDRWNRLKGCDMMEEMWPYCGTSQRVFKRVEKFLDERDYRIKRCSGIVLLEGLMCEGTVDFGPCDRSCYYFWREEWLEKMG